MTRNFDKRIELLFPVERPEHKARVMHALRSMFRDNVKARQLNPDGSYSRRVPAAGEAICRVQQSLQDEVKRIASLAREVAGVSFEAAHPERQSR
jgi:polyphosphate kinase